MRESDVSSFIGEFASKIKLENWKQKFNKLSSRIENRVSEMINQVGNCKSRSKTEFKKM